MAYLGDYATSSVIYGKFTTYRPSTGAAYALAGTPALSVYKDNSTTQSTTGVTLTADFDTVTGLNHFAIDTSADGTFYSAGSNFDIVITTGTVDSVNVVGTVVGSFSLAKTAALRPTTAGRTLDVSTGGEAGLDWANIGSPTTSVDLSGTSTRALEPTTDGRTLDVTAGGNAGIDLDNVALTNDCDVLAILASGTLSGTHSTTTADLGTNAPATDVTGMTLYIPDRGFSRLVTSYNTGTGVDTFDTTSASLTNGDIWFVYATPPGSTSLLAPVDVKKINAYTVIGAGTSGDKWRA
jgi:hypothetical protein